MIRAQRRLWVAAGSAAVLATGLSGCGIQPTGISVLGNAPTAAAPSAGSNAPSGPIDGQLLIYLLQVQDGKTVVVPVHRAAPAQVTDGAMAELLVKGPTPEELKEGFTSDVPQNLVVTPNALGFSDSYGLSTYLGSWAKTQFICTMQEFDQSQSVGYYYPGTGMTQAVWLACEDTTGVYVNMPGFADSRKSSGPLATISPSDK